MSLTELLSGVAQAKQIFRGACSSLLLAENQEITFYTQHLRLEIATIADDRVITGILSGNNFAPIYHANPEFIDRELRRGVKMISDTHDWTIVNFKAIDASNNKIIGFAQLHNTFPHPKMQDSNLDSKWVLGNNENWIELAYHVKPEYWQNGWGAELGKGLIELSTKGLGAMGVYTTVRPDYAPANKALVDAASNWLIRIPSKTFTLLGAR